ncbi:MAG: tetratricopeptide repeat protein [Planctomycetes bacterium]|nr:tetratricopeptide repeat protein [Planctomycetota bacterium]
MSDLDSAPNAALPSTPVSREELEAKAHGARRLGQLILENKTGAALAAGVPHFREAALLWAQLGSANRQAECLMDLGRLHAKSGHHGDAAKTLVEALRTFESASEVRLAMEAAGLAGQSYLAGRDTEQALKYLRRALECGEQLNDHVQIGQCLLELAQGYVATQKPTEALKCCERALAIFTSFRQGPSQAQTHECMALAQAVAGDAEASAAQFEKSVEISTALARVFEATETLSRFAEMERKRGNFEGAIAIHERCIAIHKQTDNRALLAQTLRRLGLVHSKRGAVDDALACYQRAADICDLIKDQDGLSRSLYLLGVAEANAQRGEGALTHLVRSLGIAESTDNLTQQEQVLSAMASLYRQLGQGDKALATMHQWVLVLAKLGDRADQLRVLGSMAEIQQEMGAYDEAEKHLRRLIEACTHPEDQHERVRAHHNLATILAKRGAHQDAVEHLTQALPGFADEPAIRARILHQLGYSALHLNDAKTALKHLEDSLELYDQIKDEKARARLLVDVGNAQVQLGNTDGAKQLFEQAANLCEDQGDMRATTIIRKASRGLG